MTNAMAVLHASQRGILRKSKSGELQTATKNCNVCRSGKFSEVGNTLGWGGQFGQSLPLMLPLLNAVQYI